MPVDSLPFRVWWALFWTCFRLAPHMGGAIPVQWATLDGRPIGDQPWIASQVFGYLAQQVASYKPPAPTEM